MFSCDHLQCFHPPRAQTSRPRRLSIRWSTGRVLKVLHGAQALKPGPRRMDENRGEKLHGPGPSDLMLAGAYNCIYYERLKAEILLIFCSCLFLGLHAASKPTVAHKSKILLRSFWLP